ncbi:MAG: heme-binding protein, partial [Pseudonocardiaceae bacterium]
MSVPSTDAPSTDAPVTSLDFRQGLSLAATAGSSGPLADLAGTWIGKGFSLISPPGFNPHPPSTGPLPFRLKLNSTVEILEFTPIGAAVPNRGSTGQLDINIFGLRYLQRIADVVTDQPLHIEPGLWLTVPATTVPPAPATVVRQATIPHGNSLLTLGTALTVPSGPQIGVVDSTPTKNPNTPPPLGLPYLAPFVNPPLPPSIKLSFVKNSNLALQQAIAGQKIIKTVVLIISTTTPANSSLTQAGGILNIPFDVSNANATRLDAIFWIETVQQAVVDTQEAFSAQPSPRTLRPRSPQGTVVAEVRVVITHTGTAAALCDLDP